MKTMQRSWGNFCRLVGVGLFFLFSTGLLSCQSPSGGERSQFRESGSGEISLASDQQEIAELRKNIPPEKRRENDELKEYLQLTAELRDHPSRVREKFYKQTQKLRDQHRREMRRAREDFNRDEKKKRDLFYQNMKRERDAGKRKKMTREQQKDFYDNLERKRKDFASQERDVRNQFFADLKVKEDDFAARMRERNNDFTDRMREYTQKYEDLKKAEERARQTPNSPTGSAPQPLVTPPGGSKTTIEPLKTGEDEK